MRIFLIVSIFPLFLIGQNKLNGLSDNGPFYSKNLVGCEDADEVILNILSIFINDPEFGFFGCADIIPYLESQTIIPLNCSTNLTPLGYFNMSVSDVCECSCQEFLNLYNTSLKNPKIIKNISILGQGILKQTIFIEVYDD